MNKKEFSKEESFAIISEMIANKRAKMEKNSSIVFLIWGYLLTITAIIMFVSERNSITISPLWWLVPIAIGFVAMIVVQKRTNKSRQVKSYFDKVINLIWKAVVATAIVLVLVCVDTVNFNPNSLYGIILFTAAFGMLITGGILKSRLISGCSGMAMVMSIFLIFRETPLIPPLIEVAVAVMALFVIPGHIMLYKSRKQK